jgi:8-oxo-dGTP diphosphatase
VNDAPPADLPLPPAAGQLVTLCFIVHEGRVLLMRKLRGIGAGKINGPGGKVEPGETALAAAIRETQEEVGVTPLAPELRGELDFYFEGGPTLHCLIFLARAFSGVPVTTAEAEPLWFPADELPYGEMWSDDRHWLPLLLAGDRFTGWVTVRGETVLSLQIERRLSL